VGRVVGARIWGMLFAIQMKSKPPFSSFVVSGSDTLSLTLHEQDRRLLT